MTEVKLGRVRSNFGREGRQTGRPMPHRGMHSGYSPPRGFFDVFLYLFRYSVVHGSVRNLAGRVHSGPKLAFSS